MPRDPSPFTMEILTKIEQRSREWHALHRARLTASNFDVVMNGTPRAWRKLQIELRNGRKAISAPALEWGIKYEPAALASYELHQGVSVRRVGFIVSDDIRFGCSPDGLLHRFGMVEVKCPYNPEVHEETLRLKRMPAMHTAQVQGGMWVAKRRYCIFISFDPRQPKSKRLFYVDVPRDDEYIARLAERCALFMELFEKRRNPETWLHRSAPKLF